MNDLWFQLFIISLGLNIFLATINIHHSWSELRRIEKELKNDL